MKTNPIVNPGNNAIIRNKLMISVHATLDGIGQAALTAAEIACRNALSKQFKDLVLYQDSGSPSATKLLNSTSITGVKIVDGPSFQEVTRGEYVNCRTVDFMAEAEYVVPGTEGMVLQFSESVDVQGDGSPQIVWRFPINATAIPQIVSPTSLIITTQSGQAVGHTRYPRIPPPMFGKKPRGGIYRGDKSHARELSPRAYGRGWVEYPVEWSYVWESILPLDGSPSRPPLY